MEKRKKKFGILVGILIGLTIGILIQSFLSSSKAVAENSDLERAVSAKHGYGVYLQFEYEIVTNSYGNFVVIKPRYGDQDDLKVAGL